MALLRFPNGKRWILVGLPYKKNPGSLSAADSVEDQPGSSLQYMQRLLNPQGQAPDTFDLAEKLITALNRPHPGRCPGENQITRAKQKIA